MKFGVVTFPGSNCDRDMDVALKKFGFKNKMVWHDDVELPKSDLVVLPGGFSYGDYLRCGSMASKSKIMKSTFPQINWQTQAAMLHTGFQPLKINDSAIYSKSFILFSILPQLYYPIPAYDSLFRASHDDVSKFLFKYYPYRKNVVIPPLPRRNPYNILPKTALSLNDTLLCQIDIDLDGTPNLKYLSSPDENLKKAVIRLLSQNQFYPARNCKGNPQPFSGYLEFQPNNSVDIRIRYFWLE